MGENRDGTCQTGLLSDSSAGLTAQYPDHVVANSLGGSGTRSLGGSGTRSDGTTVDAQENRKRKREDGKGSGGSGKSGKCGKSGKSGAKGAKGAKGGNGSGKSGAKGGKGGGGSGSGGSKSSTSGGSDSVSKTWAAIMLQKHQGITNEVGLGVATTAVADK
jgi:hypothetical protein